jgi:hypothetical protein
MRKYVLALDLILLITCALILIIDLRTKDELIQRAIKLEEKINEQRGYPGNDNIRAVVPGDLPHSDVFLDSPVSSPDHTENGSGTTRPRKRNTASANRRSGNPDKGIPGPDDTVGS